MAVFNKIAYILRLRLTLFGMEWTLIRTRQVDLCVDLRSIGTHFLVLLNIHASARTNTLVN